ncbi:hypothetical protein [Bosea massiliensis]|uniref:Uncharacterized protein n=1 Tax=Bosea massiliensis TaxID=151419 RepID=A0ABW0P2R9_9HYPH
MTTTAPASCRSGSLTLPFVGSAHAVRWPADHGRGVTIDRESGSATIWLGRWQVHVDFRPGSMSGAAVAVLVGGAMLAALLGRR